MTTTSINFRDAAISQVASVAPHVIVATPAIVAIGEDGATTSVSNESTLKIYGAGNGEHSVALLFGDQYAHGTNRGAIIGFHNTNRDGQITFGKPYNQANVAHLILGISSTTAVTAPGFYSHRDGGGNLTWKHNATTGATNCDGAFTGGGADYAEMFEWDDGNPGAEDRVGMSVVLTNGNKIRQAAVGDVSSGVFGVVSARPTSLGNTQWQRWHGKYEKDEFDREIVHDVEYWKWWDSVDEETGIKTGVHLHRADAIPEGLVVNEATKTVQTIPERTLSAEFDENAIYTPRTERKEWSAVGMVGVLRIRAGQLNGERWKKLRDVSENVEEWLVR